jgi:hypothetical protein
MATGNKKLTEFKDAGVTRHQNCDRPLRPSRVCSEKRQSRNQIGRCVFEPSVDAGTHHFVPWQPGSHPEEHDTEPGNEASNSQEEGHHLPIKAQPETSGNVARRAAAIA